MTGDATVVRRPSTLTGLAVLAVVVFAANDAAVTYDVLAFLAVAGGGVLGLATGLASRDEPLAVFASSMLMPVGGVAVLAAAGFSLADLPLLEGVLDPLVLVALAAAGFGAVAAFTGGVGGGAVGRAFSVVVATTILPFLAAVVAFLGNIGSDAPLVDVVAGASRAVARLVVAPTGTGVDVVVFVVVLAAAARALAGGVTAAPLAELAPRARRSQVARASQTVVSVCLSVWRLLAVLWGLFLVAFVFGFGTGLVDPLPDALLALVGGMASSSVLRVVLLVVVAVSGVVAGGLRLARLVTGDVSDGLRRVAPTAGSGVLAVVVGVVYAQPLVRGVVEALPEQSRELAGETIRVFGTPTLALLGLVVPLVCLSALLLAFAGLGRLRAIPKRGAPAAVAAAGLVLAGAFAGVQNAAPGFVFALVAAGMVVWDVGEYGVGLVAELDRRAPSARAEFVHVGAAVGVGLVAYYGTSVLHDLTAGVGTPDGATALAVLVGGAIGVAALVAALAE
ncbi:DUF7519 family protein [Halobacterium zhouii]|uniref:DUF7519 family protein n=1 Tax=Halobacterium zhouii TaxID=2902624 RepID=UPI001E422754|nr:hypothetical protein [Halobacterium zhouii]